MNWRSYPITRMDEMPRGSGLYAVYLDGRLAYIGRTTNLRSRIKQHKISQAAATGVWRGRAFDHLAIKAKVMRAHVFELDAAERRLIVRLRPDLNITFGPAASGQSRAAPESSPCALRHAPDALVRKLDSEADAVAVAMKYASVNLAAVAASMGVSEATVSLWRSGKRRMRQNRVKQFCIATGTTLLQQYRDLRDALAEANDIDDRRRRNARLARMMEAA